ncbi:MAG: SRPBCC family protein [Prevotella sp.]|nr:SRPBCC family protein [Prevotella sp.]
MASFESKVKEIPYPQESVYRLISDLNNLERIRDRIPTDKIQDFSYDSDSVTVNVPLVGTVSMRVVERTEPECVKFESVQSPMSFNLWVEVMPDDDNASKVKVSVKADIPFMLAPLVSGPLQDGLDKVVEALSMIQYE